MRMGLYLCISIRALSLYLCIMLKTHFHQKSIHSQWRSCRFGPTGRRIHEGNGGLARHSRAVKETARVGVRAPLIERAEGKSGKPPPGDHTMRKRGARRWVRWELRPPPRPPAGAVPRHTSTDRAPRGGERRAGPAAARSAAPARTGRVRASSSSSSSSSSSFVLENNISR